MWVAEADTLRAATGTNCELQDTSYGGKLTEMAFNGTATMAANEPVLSAVHAGTPILQIRDLRTNLLELAALSLSAGECIAVQGPSGAGKTLLLRAIADLDPNEGLVCLEGRDRSTIPGPGWRRLVGYVPAEPGWWADTVGEHFSDMDGGTRPCQGPGVSRGGERLADRPAVDRRAAAARADPCADGAAKGAAAR